MTKISANATHAFSCLRYALFLSMCNSWGHLLLILTDISNMELVISPIMHVKLSFHLSRIFIGKISSQDCASTIDISHDFLKRVSIVEFPENTKFKGKPVNVDNVVLPLNRKKGDRVGIAVEE